MHSIDVLAFIAGFTILLSIVIHYIFHKTALPALIGYIFPGTSINYADSNCHFPADNGYQLFEYLSTPGIISLLFRVGLESELPKPPGKLIGAGGTTFLITGSTSALLLGVSMLTGGKVFMMVPQKGHDPGSRALPPPCLLGDGIRLCSFNYNIHNTDQIIY